MKIIDLREKSLYDISHVEGSINIPYEYLISNYKTILNKSETYYFYCNKGILSNRVVNILSSLGYKAFTLEKWFYLYYNYVDEYVRVC